jgi:hypothetical protein
VKPGRARKLGRAAIVLHVDSAMAWDDIAATFNLTRAVLDEYIEAAGGYSPPAVREPVEERIQHVEVLAERSWRDWRPVYEALRKT